MGLRPHSLQARLLYTGPGRRSQDYFFIYKLRGAAGRRCGNIVASKQLLTFMRLSHILNPSPSWGSIGQ